MNDCPCRGCTPDTGRAPGCHSPDCPHGWYEWDRAHKAERDARNAADYADSVLTDCAVRAAKARKKSRR